MTCNPELCQERLILFQQNTRAESEGERLALIAGQMAESERPCLALCKPYLNSLSDLLKIRRVGE